MLFTHLSNVYDAKYWIYFIQVQLSKCSPQITAIPKAEHINLFFLWCLVSSSYHTKSFTIILRKYEKCHFYIWFHNVRKYDFPMGYSQLVSGWCEHDLWKEHVACFVHTTLKESLWHASGWPGWICWYITACFPSDDASQFLFSLTIKCIIAVKGFIALWKADPGLI